MIIADREPDVPFTDLLVYLLRNVVALSGQPMIHQLPALEGEVPDCLLFWGGDDEAAAGTQVRAAHFMAERGLPYHINIMPRDGRFTVSPEEFGEMRELGTEPSLHLNFIDGYEHPLAFTHEDVRAQVELYRQAYGETPVCTVFHWTLWHGWTEPAQWLREEGVLADNSRFNYNKPVLNPTNSVGYAYGTCFPFFMRLDWRGGNRRLDFISEPITAYECGYVREGDADPDTLHRALSNAAFWHQTCNMFYHPVCIFRFAECKAAIDALLAYLAERGIRAVHMGNDGVSFWWRARSAAAIEDARCEADGVSFSARCEWDGYVVTVPLPGEQASAEVDGEPAWMQVRHEYGRWWGYIPLQSGAHRVRVNW